MYPIFIRCGTVTRPKQGNIVRFWEGDKVLGETVGDMLSPSCWEGDYFLFFFMEEGRSRLLWLVPGPFVQVCGMVTGNDW